MTYSVNIIKSGMNGSSTIDAAVIHRLKGRAAVGCETNAQQIFRLDLFESEILSIVFFLEPKLDGALNKLLLLLFGIPKTFICKHKEESTLSSLFCSLCTSVYTSHQ